MRPLVYYIASTLDGFIAREDGSFDDFPMDEAYLGDLMSRYPETFPAPFRDPSVTRADNRRFDAVLMGRATYQVGLDQGLSCPYPTLDQYVFSRSLGASPDPAVTLVSEDATGFVADLKQQEGRAIWLCGGGQLATTLLDAGLVDEVVVKLNPILFGTGIPLLQRQGAPLPLRLTDSHAYASGHLLLSYAVDPGSKP